MKYIQGASRIQFEFSCLEERIHQQNEVGLIDLFVGSLALNDYGFKLDFVNNSRPAYHLGDLHWHFILNRATADVGLIFTAYNLKRLFNMLDKNTLNAYLKAICLLFPALFVLIRGLNRHFKTTKAAIQNKYPQIINHQKPYYHPYLALISKIFVALKWVFRRTNRSWYEIKFVKENPNYFPKING